jgi:hypothetical protein
MDKVTAVANTDGAAIAVSVRRHSMNRAGRFMLPG